MDDPHEPLVSRKGRPPSATRSRPVAVFECRKHGWVEFGNYLNGGRSRWLCKKCCAEAVTRRHHKVRAILIAEAGGRCAICGYDRCVLNLHFHHVYPEQKSFNMTVASGKGLKARQEEARKCVLLCANCHGEVEAGIVPSPPPMAKFGEAWVPLPTPGAETDCDLRLFSGP
jgi:cytochrome c553